MNDPVRFRLETVKFFLNKVQKHYQGTDDMVFRHDLFAYLNAIYSIRDIIKKGERFKESWKKKEKEILAKYPEYRDLIRFRNREVHHSPQTIYTKISSAIDCVIEVGNESGETNVESDGNVNNENRNVEIRNDKAGSLIEGRFLDRHSQKEIKEICEKIFEEIDKFIEETDKSKNLKDKAS